MVELAVVAAEPDVVAAAEQLGVVAELDVVPVAEPLGVVAGPGAVPVVGPLGVVAEPDAVPVAEPLGVAVAPGVVPGEEQLAAADLFAATLVAEPHDADPAVELLRVAELHCAAAGGSTDVPAIAELLGAGPVAGPVDAAVAADSQFDSFPATPAELARCDPPQVAA